MVIVGASRGAADDLARAIAVERGATFGLTRFSLTELAARAAAPRSSPASGASPGTQAGAEAVAARAVFDAVAAGELEYFGPVARMPGFPKALARTLHELRLAGVDRGTISDVRTCRRAAMSASCWRASRQQLAAARRSTIAPRCSGSRPRRAGRAQVRWATLPMVLLDVPLDSRAEREFVARARRALARVLATVPDGDDAALAALLRAPRPAAIEIAG